MLCVDVATAIAETGKKRRQHSVIIRKQHFEIDEILPIVVCESRACWQLSQDVLPGSDAQNDNKMMRCETITHWELGCVSMLRLEIMF